VVVEVLEDADELCGAVVAEVVVDCAAAAVVTVAELDALDELDECPDPPQPLLSRKPDQRTRTQRRRLTLSAYSSDR
jgi:hypothetical protein